VTETADPSTTRQDGRRFGPGRREARSFLELFALTGIAFVQPALDVLRRNSKDVFVAAGAGRFEILALVAIILLVPPIVLWAAEVSVGLVAPGIRRFVHVVLAGAVVALITFEVLSHQGDWGDPAKVAVGVLTGGAAALLLLRVDVVGQFLRYLALAPVAFTCLFLVNNQVSPLVLDTGVAKGAGVTISRPNRVVMIVMDELPTESLLDGTGHVDAALFPNFAALAAGSTWYRNSTSVSPLTTSAVPALLTGNYPTDPRAVQTASVFPHNLFTLVGDSYTINAHENLEALNPSGDAEAPKSLGSLVSRTVELWRRTITNAPFQFEIPTETANEQVPAMHRFVRSLGDRADRQLDYVHVLLPHSPWYFLPDGRTYTHDTKLPGLVGGWSGSWGGGPQLSAVARQRHILQLELTDRLIGRVVTKLKRLGVYDKTLLVVTADHGEGFTGYNPQRVATPDNYSEIMWAPLFIKSPGQTGGKVDDRLARSIDVLPTIADVLGTKLPWKVDGRSLLGPAHPNGPRRFLETTTYARYAPAEATFHEWDGVKGFARVLASRAAAAGPVGNLRVYEGTSEFGDLVGRSVAPLVAADAPTVPGWIAQPWLYTHVDPGASFVPWAYVEGHASIDGSHDVAIAINGTIASVTTSFPDRIFGGAGLISVLPPSLFKPGDNDIQMYVVGGTPAAPTLEPVTRTGEIGAPG
jgi:arylsulfatase A-like enzyme